MAKNPRSMNCGVWVWTGSSAKFILCVEVPAGTSEEFVTNCCDKNGCIIEIIGQLFVNDSVQFLGVPDQASASGLPLICNLLDHVEATGLQSGNSSNQDWGCRSNDDCIMSNFSWGASVNPCPDYLPLSPVIPRAARRRVCDDFLHYRHQERLWRQYNRRNILVNFWVHCKGENRDGLVTQ